MQFLLECAAAAAAIYRLRVQTEVPLTQQRKSDIEIKL